MMNRRRNNRRRMYEAVHARVHELQYIKASVITIAMYYSPLRAFSWVPNVIIVRAYFGEIVYTQFLINLHTRKAATEVHPAVLQFGTRQSVLLKVSSTPTSDDVKSWTIKFVRVVPTRCRQASTFVKDGANVN